jgi:WD40 repeat protein
LIRRLLTYSQQVKISILIRLEKKTIFSNFSDSKGHDCSIRLWNLENKNCVQEMTSHRKKHDESINCVAFHQKKPYIASGGADAIVKIYV